VGVRGVGRIGEGNLLEFEAKGGLFILGGEYVGKEEGCIGVLFPEPIGDDEVSELLVTFFPVVVHFLK